VLLYDIMQAQCYNIIHKEGGGERGGRHRKRTAAKAAVTESAASWPLLIQFTMHWGKDAPTIIYYIITIVTITNPYDLWWCAVCCTATTTAH
jgi:hypothetical protein